MSPYRKAAEVPPVIVNPTVRALREAKAVPFVDLRGDGANHEATCPMCGSIYWYMHGPQLEDGGRVCAGSWWLFACQVRAPHFHVRCSQCGGRWIMAPKNVDL